MQGNQVQSKIIGQEKAFEAKWLGLRYISFSIGEKVINKYEGVYRTTRKEDCEIDGVQIIPIINYKDKPSQLLLIANFRPPAMKFALEFPAGLVEDKNYEENARREMLQQTGYEVEKFIELPMPPIYCDPWKSNESGLLYIAMINGDDPKAKKEQNLDGEQNIKVVRVPFDEKLMYTISDLVKENDYALQSKLWSICLGLTMSKYIKKQ